MPDWWLHKEKILYLWNVARLSLPVLHFFFSILLRVIPLLKA